MTLLAPATATGSGGAAADSLAILSMVWAVRAPSFLIRSSYAVGRTPNTIQILVRREGNNRAAVLCFFIAQSIISRSLITPTSIGSPLTMTYKRINLSCETEVVCVMGINLNFRNLTQILAMGFKSILFMTIPFSFDQELIL